MYVVVVVVVVVVVGVLLSHLGYLDPQTAEQQHHVVTEGRVVRVSLHTQTRVEGKGMNE